MPAGQPGIRLRDAATGKTLYPKLRHIVTDWDAKNQWLILTYEDTDLGVWLYANFRMVEDSGVIEAYTTLNTTKPVHIDWLAAPVMPAPQQSEEMIDFAGRWIGEFQAVHTP